MIKDSVLRLCCPKHNDFIGQEYTHPKEVVPRSIHHFQVSIMIGITKCLFTHYTAHWAKIGGHMDIEISCSMLHG